jgi:murein lipoprotein
MRSNPVRLAMGLSVLLAVSSVGCATRGSVRDLESRVDAQDRRLSGLEQQVSAAQSSADQALRRAEAAEAEARRSAQSADDAARKADAIFKKSVRK